MRKRISIILVAAFLMVGFSGCGSKKSGGGGGGGGSLLTKSSEQTEDWESVSGKSSVIKGLGEEPATEEPKTEERFPDRPDVETGNGTPMTLGEGDVAPNFKVGLVNGGTFRMSDYDDKVVLLNFWATWCSPCVREMPAFERLKADGIEGLEILCINCREDKFTVESFIESEGYTFNIGYDQYGRVESYYPSSGIPYTLVVDHGVIAKTYVGAADADTQYEEYKSAIEACLK